ncbi:MAG: hypothetical protein C4522_01970 [Desulfobacteraceae bacterium]|nr:MAG: hypothetical protein C4522_01970 [Desulfobacteraceae bacterium]
MEPLHGTYALVLKSKKKQTAKVGKLGSLSIHQGPKSIPKFGSSDCKCNSHLFDFKSRPDFHAFFRTSLRSAFSFIDVTIIFCYTIPKSKITFYLPVRSVCIPYNLTQ